jgi:hypothetical protein
MAIKTFTTGEVLTASDTNTYLANSGLVYITEGTATSGSTFSVNNCFTSTYASYLVQFSVIPTAGAYGIDVRLRASGTDTSTGYYWGVTAIDVGTGAINLTRGSNSTLFTTYAIAGTSGRATCVMNITNPQLAQYTSLTCQSTDSRGASSYVGINAGGQLANNTQYDGITFLLGGGSGTISNFQVKIYGYRQA